MRLAAGFMAAKHLFAASELGLFEALADAPATLDALAARTGLTPRTARISADAMVALGLIERDGDAYRNGAAADLPLRHRPGRPASVPAFWDRISYPAWTDLADALGKGPVNRDLRPGRRALQEIASAGIEAVLAGPAAALANTVEFADRQRLLDVGGGTGSWSIAVVAAHPHMTATVVELPRSPTIARVRIAEAGLTARIDVVTGDALMCAAAGRARRLPGRQPRPLLLTGGEPTAAASHPGCAPRPAPGSARRLLDRPHAHRAADAALMAGEFAVHLRHGDVYSVDEVRAGSTKPAGASSHAPLAGPQSLVVATADQR